MNLRQLEVFYAIMQAGTVSGAARNLHVSQPNVTRVLAHTEQQLGFSLFERIKGRLVPTQEGKALCLKWSKEFGMPVTDPVRCGVSAIAERVRSL